MSSDGPHPAIASRGYEMAAHGASCPFRLVLANVPSPNPQQPFAADDSLLGQAVRRACS